MNLLIFLVITLVLTYFSLVTYQNYRNNLDSPDDLNDLEEWDCPECGFHVQLGESCIYCGEVKPTRF